MTVLEVLKVLYKKQKFLDDIRFVWTTIVFKRLGGGFGGYWKRNR